MWIGEVGDVMSTGPTLVSSFRPDLQRGLLGLMLLLTELPAYVLLTTTVLLSVLAVLSMLGLLLLLQRCSIWLQHNAIHSTAQCVLSS